MSGTKRFEKLLEPGYIGTTRIRNRMVKTAQGSSRIETSGYVGEQAKAYYDYLSSGGIGLLIVESCGVEYPLGVHHPSVQFHLDDDKYIPSYSELAQVVHKNGCPIFLQLFHSGAWNPTGALTGREAKSSSAMTKEELPGPDFVETRGLSAAEVEEVIEMFIKAAERAQKAGFDGVEVNVATCTLPNSFLSRVWNKRTDKYGCDSLENRIRFVTDIIHGIKERCGQDFTVITLVNIAEYGHEKATTVEEGVQFAKFIEDAGADAIQVRAHLYGHRGGLLHPDRFFYPELMDNPPKDLDWSNKGKGAIIPLAEAVKKVVSVPVIAACRLDPVLGEQLLEQGKLDYVGMTRRILADPELPNKVAEGRLDDIRPCVGCLWCMDVRLHNQPVRCRVNAKLSRETEYITKPAEKKKRVLVVGGGPAGMEAARVAALRGHEVILYEKEPKLGGAIPVASIVKDLEIEDLAALVRYFKTQLTKLGVTIRLGKEVNLSVIKEIKPDVVVLATGGRPTIPGISGINRRNVLSSSKLHHTLKNYLRFLSPKTLERLTKVWMPIGKRVVIIGGAIQGYELAEFLVKRGRKVAIVDTAAAQGEGMTEDDKGQLFKWLDKKGATMLTEVKYEEITNKGLVITTKEGERQTLEADSIVTALSFVPNADLHKSLEGKAPEIYLIGDCKEPRLIPDAIADGWQIAHTI